MQLFDLVPMRRNKLHDLGARVLPESCQQGIQQIGAFSPGVRSPLCIWKVAHVCFHASMLSSFKMAECLIEVGGL